MNPGPPRGDTRKRTITVTEEMTARIGEREIHPVYGTVPLIAHVEEICREILEPHLEAGEEGVGYRLELRHHAPAPVGADITLVASVADIGQNRLLCDFAARDDGSLVATGSFEQRVVPAAEFAARIRSRTSQA